MIQSLPSFAPLYGYFEARLKIDTASVTGHWPAWWASCSTVNTWPPETDFFEYFASGTTYENNTYIPGGPNFNSTATATVTNYNVYGCRWNSTNTTWYLNGTQTNQTSASNPAAAMYLILNNGARTPTNPVFSSNGMSVDYVRAWS
jgi:hypothetical protein